MAALQYTAACSGGSGASEAGRCSASLAVQAQPPWKLGLQLLGPPATHTLLAALQPAAGGGSGTSGSEGGAGVMPLEQQQRRLQGLSVQDTPAPPSAATEAAMGEGARDLSVLLLRSLPPRLVLPARQRCGALVQLQSMAACQLDILAVEVEAAEGVVVVPAAAPAVPARGGGGGGVDAPADTLGRSDIFATAFTISSSSSGAAAELPSLGFLRLRWRRHQRRPPLLAAAARGTSQLSAAAAQAAAAEVLPGSGVDGAGSPRAQAAAAAVAAPACEVLVPLPAVCFLPPLLTAEMRFPPAATAGSPTELLLQLRNGGSTCQEVAVTVGDPHGFLLAGECLDWHVGWPAGGHMTCCCCCCHRSQGVMRGPGRVGDPVFLQTLGGCPGAPYLSLQGPRRRGCKCCRTAQLPSAGRQCHTTQASGAPWAQRVLSDRLPRLFNNVLPSCDYY